jgi:hypothetical protein
LRLAPFILSPTSAFSTIALRMIDRRECGDEKGKNYGWPPCLPWQ